MQFVVCMKWINFTNSNINNHWGFDFLFDKCNKNKSLTKIYNSFILSHDIELKNRTDALLRSSIGLFQINVFNSMSKLLCLKKKN